MSRRNSRDLAYEWPAECNHSEADAPVLRRACCARCAQSINVVPDCNAHFGKPGNKRCDRCAKMNKHCEELPKVMFGRIEHMLAIIDGDAGGDLALALDTFKKELAANRRSAGREGESRPRHSKPKSDQDFRLLELSESRRRNAALENQARAMDSIAVSLAALADRFAPPSAAADPMEEDGAAGAAGEEDEEGEEEDDDDDDESSSSSEDDDEDDEDDGAPSSPLRSAKSTPLTRKARDVYGDDY